jgi:RHS repeat-associated protein
VLNQHVDGSVTTTGYTYFPNGQRQTQTKSNQNTVTYTYNLDGTLAKILEATAAPGLNLVDFHNLTYDENNNVRQDIAGVRNADQTDAFRDRTRNFEYSPNNQLTTVKDESAKTNESYEYDSLGEITKQTLGDKPAVDNSYDRGRLMSSSQGAVAYQYDAIGRMTAIGNRTLDGAGREVYGAAQQYRYDGYDNLVYQSGTVNIGTPQAPVQATSATTSTYDSLNRPITTKVDMKGGGLPFSEIGHQTFDYLATSRAVATQETILTPGGTSTDTYDYAPTGERLALHDSFFDPTQPPGTNQDGYFTYNPHQDVEALTGPDGYPINTYGYTAYGQDDQGAYGDKTLDSGPDKDTTLPFPLNSYRFNSARQTSGTGNLDMGFRTYNPGIGQFLNRDSYNGAGADAALAGGRYGFAGGNPLSNIEQDGHSWKGTLASFGAALAVVAVCAALGVGTAGLAAVACAVGAGAAAGAAGQGVACGEGQAGACSAGAFVTSIGIGAATGLIGAGIGAGVAGLLPEGLSALASGAIVGTAAGAGAGAGGYGLGCLAGSECSWSGLGMATVQGAAMGGVLGGAFGKIGQIRTARAGGASGAGPARVVDMFGREIGEPDPIAAKIRDYTNQALREFESGEIGFSEEQLEAIATSKNPVATEAATRGRILDARVKALVANDEGMTQLYPAQNGEYGPDWVNGGRRPNIGWYDLTSTMQEWIDHVVKYAPRYGPGIGILWK